MEFIINSEISFPKSSQNTDFRYKITVILLYQNDGYSLSVGYEKDGFAFLIDGFELSKKKSFDCSNQKCKKQRMYLMVSIDDFDPLKS